MHGNLKAVACGERTATESQPRQHLSQRTHEKLTKVNVQDAAAELVDHEIGRMTIAQALIKNIQRKMAVRLVYYPASQHKSCYLPRIYPTILMTAKLLVYVVRCSSHSSLLVLLSHKISYRSLPLPVVRFSPSEKTSTFCITVSCS